MGMAGRRRGLIVFLLIVVLVLGALVTTGVLKIGGGTTARVVASGPGVMLAEAGHAPKAVDVTAEMGRETSITTPSGASASLTFPDGSRTVLGRSSKLTITSFDMDWSGTVQVALALDHGMAWNVVAPGHGTFQYAGLRPGSRVVGTSTAYAVIGPEAAPRAPQPVRVDLFQGVLIVHDGGGGAVWQLQAGQAVTFKADGGTAMAANTAEDVALPFVTQNLRSLFVPSANLNSP